MSCFVDMIEDNGDLVDIHYYDSRSCFMEGTLESADGHAWPGGMETDYDVHCNWCGALMWKGLEQ